MNKAGDMILNKRQSHTKMLHICNREIPRAVTQRQKTQPGEGERGTWERSVDLEVHLQDQELRARTHNRVDAVTPRETACLN